MRIRARPNAALAAWDAWLRVVQKFEGWKDRIRDPKAGPRSGEPRPPPPGRERGRAGEGRLAGRARGLDHPAVVLLAAADVEIHAEPDSQRVEVGVAALDRRGALALEVADFERVHDARLAEEVPRGFGEARVLRIGQVGRGDDLEVLVRQDVHGGADDVVGAAGHDEGGAARQLERLVLERRRHEQELGLDADRLSVGVDLVEVRLDGLLERVGAERGRRPGKQVLVLAAEERAAVGLHGVGEKTPEEELVDQPGRAVAHRHRDLQERPEVVVDDHLAGEAELLGVGVDLVPRRLFLQASFLDLAVRGDGFEIAHVGETEAVALLEVVQVALRAELRREDRLGLVGLKELLVGDVAEDARQGHGRKGRLDGLVVHRAGDGLALDAEALGEESAQREVAVGHGGLGHLLAVVLRDGVLGDAGAEAHGRLEGLAVGAGLGLHDHVGGGDGLALAVRGEDGGRGAAQVPALVDGLRLDVRELAAADLADLGHAAALGLDGLLRGERRIGRGGRVLRRQRRFRGLRCGLRRGGRGRRGRYDGAWRPSCRGFRVSCLVFVL